MLNVLIMEEEEEMVGRQFNSFEGLESSGGLSQWCEKYIATVAISIASLSQVIVAIAK